MRTQLKYHTLSVLTCLVLSFFIAGSVCTAQEKSTEELKKEYAVILGEYEFNMDGGTFILNYYFEGSALWVDSGDGRPATMEPVENKKFEFTAEDPESGLFTIRFLKNDQGKYTICHVVNIDMGLDIKGNKIE